MAGKTRNPYEARRDAAIARAASAKECACGAPVLVGLDEDVMALTATVDPEPLRPAEELLAMAEGRWVYRIREHDGRRELHRRDGWQIRGEPAKPDGRPRPVIIVREHRCER